MGLLASRAGYMLRCADTEDRAKFREFRVQMGNVFDCLLRRFHVFQGIKHRGVRGYG